MRRAWFFWNVAAACALFTASPCVVMAGPVDDFYRGKTVTLAIGFSVGGGYDLYGRLVARHLGKHIPGNPTVVPQNREGAGSFRAASYIYSAAPKDGTAIGMFTRATGIATLLQSTPFDGSKFTWLGSVAQDVSICLTWHTSPIATFDDMLTKNFTFGGEGAGADPDVYTNLLKNVFGMKAKLVTGYPGTNDIGLAMERGEVDGFCGLSWSTIKARRAEQYANKLIRVPIQIAAKKEPDLPDVPLLSDVAKTEEQKQMLDVLIATLEMARPFAAPPGIPEDRKQALRAAFDATMKDPDFLADAKKLNLDVDPVSGAEIDKILANVYALPKDLIAKTAKATSN